jgi:putative Ig domain-containing protein/putative glycosyl hydrolase
MSPKAVCLNIAALWPRCSGVVLILTALLAVSSLGCNPIQKSTASNSNSSTTSKDISVSVSPVSTTVNSASIYQFVATVSNTSNTAVIWSASQGTISASGLFTAPTVSSTTNVSITAKSVESPDSQANASVMITSSGSISVSVSPAIATLVSAGTKQFTATVKNTSNSAVTWSANQGSVSASGLFTAPAVTINTVVTVTATSVADPTKSTGIAVTVTPKPVSPPLAIISTSLANVTASIPYSATLVGSGGTLPYSWSLFLGSVPTGLSLTSSTGALLGTTNQTGQFNFTVELTDSSSPAQKVTQPLALSVLSGSGASAVQPSFFGIQVNLNTSPWPDSLGVPFGGYRSLVSSQDKWSDINTSAGVFDWASSFDGWMAEAQAGGEDVMYTLYYTPGWASSAPSGACTVLGVGGCYPPADLNADGSGTDQHFKDFVAALMHHVGPGKIKYLEVWNEPNITTEWAGTTAQLVRMTQDASSVAKAIDPNVQIVGPSETGDGGGLFLKMNWLDGFFAAGGGAYIDVVGFHGYPYTGNPEEIIGRIGNMQTVMANYGQQGKPIFDTEGSWGVTNNLSDGDLQAAFTGRFYLVHIAQGVSRLYWFAWDTPNTGDFYLPSTSNTLTKAGVAYQQIRQWTLGATPAAACASSGTIWTCSFTRANAYQAIAVWDTSNTCSNGVCTTGLYSVPPGMIQYRDLTGKLTSITGTSASIGLKPILLENSSAW